MVGLISTTDKNFYVISPMRKMSPVRYATKHEAEAISCKKSERIVLIITILIGLYIYRKYDGIESIMWLSVTFLISQTGVYLLMWFSNKNLSRYNRNIHGNILY